MGGPFRPPPPPPTLVEVRGLRGLLLSEAELHFGRRGGGGGVAVVAFGLSLTASKTYALLSGVATLGILRHLFY